MGMLINGKHISADDLAEVKNPYNGEVIDTVPVSHLNNVDLAIDAAVNAKDSIQVDRKIIRRPENDLHLKFQINYMQFTKN